MICGYIVNLGQSAGKPPYTRDHAIKFARLLVAHAHTILKNENGYSESWGWCQMKRIEIKNFRIELYRDFWQP